METILIALIALKQSIKQYHWQAKSYQEHILADTLEEGIEDFIDEVAEISVVNQEETDLGAKHLLEEAAQFLKGSEGKELTGIANLFYQIVKEANDGAEKATIAGISDLYSRISNMALRKLYLIDIQLGK